MLGVKFVCPVILNHEQVGANNCEGVRRSREGDNGPHDVRHQLDGFHKGMFPCFF